MYNPITMPSPEGLKPSPEVIGWAKNVDGEKTRTPRLNNLSTEIEGFSTKNLPGTDNSKLNPDEILWLSELTREITALDRDQEVRRPLVRKDLIAFRKQHPEIGGGTWDTDHGNFQVNIVMERHPKFNDSTIAASLGKKADLVYGSGTEVSLRITRSLKTEEGEEISPESTYETIRNSLLKLGATQESIDEVLTIRNIKRLAERRDNLALARQIMEGVSVEGITFKTAYRIEIDDVDKSKPIRVRRPRRTLKFHPRDKTPHS